MDRIMLVWGGWREWVAPSIEVCIIGLALLSAHLLRNLE